MKSPFKVLDAYKAEDKDIFFGRETETEALYNKIVESNLILVYGASGTGKTSIIQCGLAQKFSEKDWLPIYIRKKDNILTSVIEEVQKELGRKMKENLTAKEGMKALAAVKALTMTVFKPVFLIFDQFEELFISGTEEERTDFFDFVKKILNADFNCKLIFAMREEYIAELSGYEENLPGIFDNRVRIERMRRKKAEQVIARSAESFGIEIIEPETTIQSIAENVSEDNLVELTYLQVYLDKLYEISAQESPDRITFYPALVSRLSDIEDILSEFIEDRVHNIQKDLPEEAKEGIWELLARLITPEGTRASFALNDLLYRLESEGLQRKYLDIYVEELRNIRVLRVADGRIELTHDALAKTINEILGPEIQLRNHIRSTIEESYLLYKRTGGEELMSEKTLNYIAPHLAGMNLSRHYLQLIKLSQNRIKRIKLTIRLSIAAVIISLSALGLWAFTARSVALKRSEELRIEKEKSVTAYVRMYESKLQMEETNKKLLETNQRLDRALARLADNEQQLRERKNELENTVSRLQASERKLKQTLERVEEEKARALEMERRAVRVSREALANELAFRALVLSDTEVDYAMRVAQLAYMIDKNGNTENAVMRIFAKGKYTERFGLTGDNLAQMIYDFLQTDQIPRLTQKQMRELGFRD
jgi:hypothetical protein